LELAVVWTVGTSGDSAVISEEIIYLKDVTHPPG
jgi:hypothetical protein